MLMRLHRDEQGTVMVWLVGLVVPVLLLSGLAVDLWRALDQRRAMVGVIDAAAVAGSSGLDLDHLHATGEARLDPDRADELASQYLTRNGDQVDLDHASITVDRDGSVITVTGTTTLDFTLLSLALPEARKVGAEATVAAGEGAPQ